MTAAKLSPGHVLAPDGYCETCQLVGGHHPWAFADAEPLRGTDQLDRIELKLNQILRQLGISQ